ncbi:hypothetical protein C8R46DRAFT_997025 [Mycena filopes]|nr:hypothetical protein C8R46DRAFT_997025 [Mycena filopes]
MARLTAHNIPSTPFQIDLEKDILDVAVRRDFMSGEYGGNSQDAYPSIGAAFVAKTGKDNFAYLNLVYNPHCPQVPGAPGLMFSVDYDFALELSDDEEEEEGGDYERSDNDNQLGRENSTPGRSTKDDNKPEVKDIKKKVDNGMILFARLDTNTWQYQGQYATRDAPPLTVAEWQQQASNVRNIWTKNIADPAKDWGAYVRIPVALRRQLGRRPTEAEADAAKQAGGNFLVTPEEISTAINRGEVVIWTRTMRCIGYDVAFQRDIAAKFALFVPPPRKPRAKKNKGAQPKGKGRTGPKIKTKTKSAAKAKAKPQAKAAVGQKRKRAELESDSEDDDYEPEYRPQGTRSRPKGA